MSYRRSSVVDAACTMVSGSRRSVRVRPTSADRTRITDAGVVKERRDDRVRRLRDLHDHRRAGRGRVRHNRRHPRRCPLEPRAARPRPRRRHQLHRRDSRGRRLAETGAGRRHNRRAVRDRLRQRRGRTLFRSTARRAASARVPGTRVARRSPRRPGGSGSPPASMRWR